MEFIFQSYATKTHFHKKGCAPSLILKVRVFGTRRWPIPSWHVISMEFLYSFLRRHFAVKPLVASRKVSCFLRLWLQYNDKQMCVVWNSRGMGGGGGTGEGGGNEANNQSLKVTKLLEV